ncbi:uncharacterized protein LOC34621920 [Cyclospora cayetanensis]|uniref:Uncharacterized protein LOC34621920 n=1 Tax=Cyclospora cayetanensis TaxID=88456 RepID=A0A6P6RWD8_9EIME|nr:uncharacterized protein LOC34621920 [Cyclospora cayetanensis]
MELASCDGRSEALPSNQIAAEASVPGNPQVSPYRLLGGGLSLSPSLVFALGSRRLLEQQRKLAQEAHAGTAEASAAFTAEGTCTPVTVEGGSGGDGSVAFLRLRAAPRSGAAGGSGGRGGCVLLTAVSGPGEALADSKTSSSLRESGYWKAAPGVTGGGRGRTGCNGPDLVLGLSPNALVFDVSPLQARAASIVRRLLQRQQQEEEEVTQEQEEEEHDPREDQQQPLCCVYFSTPGETLVAARGGVGGRGNAAFVSNHNRHPLVGEIGSPGERRKLLVLENFADFVAVGLTQSGKSTLLQRLGTAASDCALGSAASVAADVHASFGSAASFTQPDDSAFRQAAEMQVDELKKQPQQWVSAAVPADVWLPTTEPTVCVIPCTAAEVPEAQQQAAQKGSVPQQEGGLLATLQEGVKLAAAAPIVALDTPGLSPAPFAAPDAADGTEAQTDSLLPPETAPHETSLQGLSAATAVLVVVDGSLPEPAKAYLTVRQQLAHANPHLAQLPAILVLTKVDLLEQQEQEQGQGKLKATELVEMMKRETGIAEVHAVSALTGAGCQELLRSLRVAAGAAPLSAKQQQQLLFHYGDQKQQRHQQQQQQLDSWAYRQAFLSAYSAVAAALPRSLLLFTVRELQQQQQHPGTHLMRRPAAAPPLRVASTSKRHSHPSFPSLDDPYKWSLVELPGQRTLEQLLNSRDLLQTAPDFESEDSTKNQRCFELRGPLVSLLTSPVRFSSEAAKLRLYRQLGALGIIERVYSDFSAKVGDYLLVGPVMLQLLPLLRNPKRRKKRSQQQELWSDDTWSFLHADGLPTKVCFSHVWLR